MYLCVKEFIFVNLLFVKNVKGKKKRLSGSLI